MSAQVSAGMIIRYASHNLRFIYSTNTENFKECPKVSTGESRRKRVPTPMHRFPMSRNLQVDHQNICQVDQYNTPLSPRVSHARHTKSVLKSLKTQSDKITSKGELNPLQEGRGGERSYDPTIIASSRYIKIVPNQEHEREIKHIATGTYPQPRGRTTPSSSWRPPG